MASFISRITLLRGIGWATVAWSYNGQEAHPIPVVVLRGQNILGTSHNLELMQDNQAQDSNQVL